MKSSLTTSTLKAVGLLLAVMLAGLVLWLFSGEASIVNLSQNQRLTMAVGLMLSAMILFAWAAPRPFTWAQADVSEGWESRRRWAFFATLGSYVISLVLYLALGESGAVRLLWMVSITMIIIAHVPYRPAWRLDRDDGRDWLIVVAITTIAFYLRFWRLPDLPAYFHGDIASQGLQALSVLEGNSPGWFDVGWSNIPMFDFVMMAGTMRLWGQDLLGLSFTAVWQSVLTVPFMYLLGREMFGRRAGLLAAALIAISYTHIHFSRIVTSASPLLFIVLLFYFLFRGLRLKRSIWFVLSGLSLGVGLLVYYPIRVAVVTVILLWLWLLIWKRRALVDNLPQWTSFCVAALVGFGPMMAFVLRDFQGFVGRGTLVMISNPAVATHLMAKYGTDSVTTLWLEQFKRTFLTFFYYPDASTHFAFSGPMINALAGLLLILGFGYCLRWLKDERYFVLVIWFTSTLLLGGVLTNDPPFWPHTIIVLPAVFLMAACAGERAWFGLLRALPTANRPRADWVIAAGLAAILVLAGISNWRAYTQQMGDNADRVVRVARYVADLPTDHHVLIVPDPLSWQQRELQFMGGKISGTDIPADVISSANLDALLQPTHFIITPNHIEIIPILQARFPNGKLHQHDASSEWHTFASFVVQPEGYVPPANVDDPARTLASRRLLTWILAAVIFVFATVFGLYSMLRISSRTPNLSISPQLPQQPMFRHEKNTDTTTKDITGWMTHDALLRALFGMAVAVVMAYLAQRFFDAAFDSMLIKAMTTALPMARSYGGRMLAGSLLYLAAMVLFARFAPAFPEKQPSKPQPASPPAIPGAQRPDATITRADTKEQKDPDAAGATSRTTYSRSQWGWLALALVPTLLSMLRFARQGEDPVVRWLWLAGIVIFLGGQVIWPAVRGAEGANAEWSPRFEWHHIVILGLILGVGFWLRFNRLDTIPGDLHGDMASMGVQARAWLMGLTPDLFREGWANIPMLGFLPVAFSLKLFGNDLFALNFSAFLAGMLTLVGLYLLVWRMFDSHRLAALATAVLTINTAHIHFSRLAAYMDPWPFILFGMFFVVDGMRSRRTQSFALSGILLALSFQMYYSGRAIVFILAVGIIYLWIVRRRWLSGNIMGIALLVMAVLIITGPSLLYFSNHWDALVERSRSVFLFYEPVMAHLSYKYNTATTTGVILQQLKQSLLMFNQSIDSSTQFGYPHPLFSSLLSPLLVLGFGYSLRRWRTPGIGLNLIWVLLLILFGSILTNNAPFWPRLVGVLPAAALLIALTFDRFWAVLSAIPSSSRHRQMVEGALGIGILVLLALVGRGNWDQYYKTVFDNARPQARIGRFLATLPADIMACNYSDPHFLNVRETGFLAHPRRLLDLPADAPDGLIERCSGPPLVWILSPIHTDRLPLLQQRWPGGEVYEHYDRNGALTFTSYLVEEDVRQTGKDNPNFISPLPTPANSLPSSAYLPDGSLFQPQQTYLGNTGSIPWQISAGEVDISENTLTLHIGPLKDHDAVYDYVKLVHIESGEVFQFEAENTELTSGDTLSTREGVDDHWWLQHYEGFSGGAGLVIQKQELAPVLTTVTHLPDGNYRLYIGSFSGDPNNGVFGLGVSWE